MTKDLTEGNTRKVLIEFTIPMFLSVIFQQLYNIADSVIAGKFAGEDALASVGASYPITMIFMAIAIGSNIGCSVVISGLFGAKQYEQLMTAVSTTIISSFILSLILTILGIAFSSSLMNMLKTPDNIFSDGVAYLSIYIGGFLFLFLYNISTGIFTSLGDSKTPLYFLIGSSIGNVVLDLLFVAVFQWGVKGVAWATFIAQGIACVLSIITLRKRIYEINSTEQYPVFSWEMLKRVASIAIPSILQQSFISIGNLFIQILVNGFGSSVIAGYSAAIKLNTFAITSLTTLGNGISGFTAQNLGALKIERVKKGFKTGIVMGFTVAFFFFLIYFGATKYMIHLFMEEEGLAIETGTQFMKIVTPFYMVVCIKLVCDAILRGAEAMQYFMITTFTDLILRVVLAYLLVEEWGTTGIWLSWPIGWSISAILSFCFYFKKVWIPKTYLVKYNSNDK